jgi:hypothetical protein
MTSASPRTAFAKPLNAAAYQVVVRCTFINKLLLAYEYHSHRVIR